MTMTHAEAYAAMVEHHKETGRWVDPVTGMAFPPGFQLVEHPNREQRRRLAKWRQSGKVKGVVPVAPSRQ